MLTKIDRFNEKAQAVFRPLLEEYGYILEEIKVNKLNGQDWSAHHIYLNKTTNMKVVIKQEPYYTDYGFSFFIHKLQSNEYNILYNIPHERQDNEDEFIRVACHKLFSSPEMTDIISGKSWIELSYIPFRD